MPAPPDAQLALAAEFAPGQFAPRPTTLKEAMEFATMICKSDLVPKDYKGRPENALVAMQMGAELGLPPLQALAHIAVVNGRPALFGDAIPALVRSAADFEDMVETVSETSATCEIRRRGRSPVVVTFTKADAERAGLWGKQGPWTQYPKRMLQMRARGFAARDAYPDRLKGLGVYEDLQDIPDPRTAPREPKRLGSLAPMPLSALPPAPVQVPQPETGPDTEPKPTQPAPEPDLKPAAKVPVDGAPMPSVERRVTINDTLYVAETKTSGAYTEVHTSAGTFATTDEQLAKSVASCAGTDHTFALTWKPTKRRTGAVVRLLLDLALDEDPTDSEADVQTGLPL